MDYVVYVQDLHGRPLMPTKNFRKVRLLLKEGAAKVVIRTPFTIRLTTSTKHYTQPITLGVDAGSKKVGLVAATEKEVLFAAELTLRNEVVGLLSERRGYRHHRRYIKGRYRKARFYNRVHGKHKGRLPPSLEVKNQEHITWILRVCKILPVSKVVIETGEFDLQKLKAIQTGQPVPQGEDYQKGEMYGFYNARQYALHRDGYACQNCKKHNSQNGGKVKLQVHHLESRKIGGDAPDNLITLCDECHTKLHAGKLSQAKLKKLKSRRLPSTRDAAFMCIMRPTLRRRLTEELTSKGIQVVETKGYVTKATREQLLHLPKSHVNDALAIAFGRDGFDLASKIDAPQIGRIYQIRAIRHHNRKLHEWCPRKVPNPRHNHTGVKVTKPIPYIRRRNQGPKYVHGFRRFDKVLYEGQVCFIGGLRSTGYFSIKLIDNTEIENSVKFTKLVFLEHSSGYLIA